MSIAVTAGGRIGKEVTSRRLLATTPRSTESTEDCNSELYSLLAVR